MDTDKYFGIYCHKNMTLAQGGALDLAVAAATFCTIEMCQFRDEAKHAVRLGLFLPVFPRRCADALAAAASDPETGRHLAWREHNDVGELCVAYPVFEIPMADFLAEWNSEKPDLLPDIVFTRRPDGFIRLGPSDGQED